MKCKIVSGSQKDEVEQEIAALLDQGYVPSGSLSLMYVSVQGRVGGNFVFALLLLKPKAQAEDGYRQRVEQHGITWS